MTDMAAVILEEAVVISVSRQAAPSYVDGRPVDGAVTARTVRGVIVPITGDVITRLPEGDSVSGSRRVISADELFVADGDVPADVVTYLGETWDVMDVDAWADHGGSPFFDSIITRVGVR